MADRRRKVFSGQEARQGEIVLRSPLQRAIFIAGLAGIVIVALLAAVYAAWG